MSAELQDSAPTIERPQWAGKTVVCIGSGPSLTAEDCDLVRASGHPVIVTNTTFRLCPWADALMAADVKWWIVYHREVAATFAGFRWSSSPLTKKYGAEVIARCYSNSGAGAVARAMELGSVRIVLLGFDACFGVDGSTHHHGDHVAGLRNADSIRAWHSQFKYLAKSAARNGVQIINSSRRTALGMFPRVSLDDALLIKD